MTAEEAYKKSYRNRMGEVLAKIGDAAERGLFQIVVEKMDWHERYKFKQKLENLGYEVKEGFGHIGYTGGMRVIEERYSIRWMNAKPNTSRTKSR